MKLFRTLALGLLLLVTAVSADADVKVTQVDDALGLTDAERTTMEASGEKHEFQAEVNRLMDIIINSLYTNREIFLRELISNSADATDKIRFMALSDPSLIGENEELDIKIQFDKEKRTITLTDKGVGMTKDDLKKNLGIVAKSGTTEFLNAAKAGSDNLSLIGQFGVGFYSVYLVADRVTVCSKHSSSDKQYIWESTANSVFTVAEDPRGNTLGRGTSITLHIKEDADEFLDEKELIKIVTRYSQFVNIPILVKTKKTVTREVPVEKEEKEEKEKAEGDDDVEVADEEEDDEPETETISEEVEDWQRVNSVKAIWTRDPKDISDEEYQGFFKSLTKDKFPDGELAHAHFSAEGEITFKSLLYIPKKADSNQYSDAFSLKKSGVHLYVRRVLISDEFEDFLPRYLNFIRGVVDSDDLPLNVSRETLAQSRVLKVMSKKLVRKILDLLRKLADAGEEGGAEAEEKVEGEEKTETKPDTRYEEFWKEHGRSIKFGVVDDRKNKSKLTKLLRYKTSKSEGKYVSLESYVKRMPADQKYIYFITGESLEKITKSPFLEKVQSKGFEVVYMDEPIDEYVVNTLTEYEGMELQSVTKENLKLGDEDRKSLQLLKEEYKPLTAWLKGIYGSKVEKVTVSNRLGESPCVLVTGQYGWSANMQRIVQGSTLDATADNKAFMGAKKTLEINVQHPIMRALNEKMTGDDESVKEMALLLLDAAVVQSGFTIDDYVPFSKRMENVVRKGLNVASDAKVDEDVEDEVKEEAAEEEAAEEEEEEEVEVEEEPAHSEL